MKKSIVLTLTDEELIELVRIIMDDDREGALKFLKKHVGDKARGALEGKGHCKPWFEVFGQSAIPGDLGKKPSGSNPEQSNH
jgi:hypothetical protein